MERRRLRPAAVPLLVVLLTLSSTAPSADGQRQPAAGGSAANVTRLALEGRFAAVRAWFKAHPESCVNQKRLMSIAAGGGLAGVRARTASLCDANSI